MRWIPRLLLLLCALSTCVHGKVLMLTNNDGATIMATPIKLKYGTLTIQRSDGAQFDLHIGALDRKSREAVVAYFQEIESEQRQTPKPVGNPDARRLTLHVNDPQIKFSLDNRYIDEAIYSDPLDDLTDANLAPQLDIQWVSLDRSTGQMRIRIRFKEVAGQSLLDAPCCVLLHWDVDCEASTGLDEGNFVGVDLVTSLNSAGDQWSCKNTATSQAGEPVQLAVNHIEASPQGLSFIVNSPIVDRAKVFRLLISVGYGEDDQIDQFPTQSTLVFSFDYGAYRKMMDEVAWE